MVPLQCEPPQLGSRGGAGGSLGFAVVGCFDAAVSVAVIAGFLAPFPQEEAATPNAAAARATSSERLMINFTLTILSAARAWVRGQAQARGMPWAPGACIEHIPVPGVPESVT